MAIRNSSFQSSDNRCKDFFRRNRCIDILQESLAAIVFDKRCRRCLIDLKHFVDAHLLQRQADLPAYIFAPVHGSNVKVPGPVKGAVGGLALLVGFEQVELAFRACQQTVAGLLGLTKSAAKELAGRNITVNAVAPGYIETDMTAGLSEEVRKAFAAQIPLGRPGSPEDVAAAVAFLASPEAGYITGQVLAVNGGMYC